MREYLKLIVFQEIGRGAKDVKMPRGPKLRRLRTYLLMCGKRLLCFGLAVVTWAAGMIVYFTESFKIGGLKMEKFQKLFDYMQEEHEVLLLDTEAIE